MTKVNWGILGTSFISEVMAQAFQDSEFANLIAIGSRSMHRAINFSEKFSVSKTYLDYEKLITDPDIQAVYIGLPNHLHKEWIIKCALAGKHILCEKPLVLDPDELYEVQAAVDAAGVYCMEALMYRHHPFAKKLKAIVESGLLGEIKLFNATYTADIAAIANPIAGGSLRNLGCYPISLIRWLANDEPEVVSAFGRQNTKTANDNQTSVLMKFTSDKLAMISTADDIAKHWHFEVHGSKGYLQSISNPWMPEQRDNIVRICLHDGTTTEINVDADKSLYAYQIDLLSSKILQHHDEQGISLEDSLGNITVIDACLKNMGF